MQESCTEIVAASTPYVAAVADVNDDGKLDTVLVADPGPGYRLVVALGDGAGRFALASSSVPSGIAGTDGASGATPIDCNGDGKTDLVVTFGNASPPRAATLVFFGDGAGGFVPDPSNVLDAGAPADDAATPQDGTAGDASADSNGVPDGGSSSDTGLGERPPDSPSGDTCTALGVTLTTDKASYTDTERYITVGFSGLRGVDDDMLTLARTPTPDDLLGDSQAAFYVPNRFSGTTTFTETMVGVYVIRYQSRSTGARFCQSAPFTILTPPTTISTDKTTYVSGQVITVSYMNLPNTGLNLLQLAVAGSTANPNLPSPLTTTNSTNGTVTFDVELAPGDYVVRAFAYSGVLLKESPPFTVTPKPSTTPTVSTDKSTYRINETITVTYAGLPGNAFDDIRLAMSTDDDALYRDIVLTNSHTSGTVTFTTSDVGSYVVRAHINGTTTVAARSAVFTVTN